jgi:hypothetical protein
MMLAMMVALATAVPPAHATATRAEYIVQVDPICNQANARIDKSLHGVGANLRRGHLPKAGARYHRAQLFFSKMLRGLAQVAPPSADADLIGRWTHGLQIQVPAVKRLVRALRRNHLRAAARFLGRLYGISAETQSLVSSYGFTWCDKA